MSDRRWTEQQKLAIDIDKHNILVSASAGSGKTAVLVERVISKVINSKIDIDSLLVVTFTNASSSELKNKLTTAIYKASKEDKNNSFLKKQLQYIHRADITTIHSFCLKIIRNNFYTLGIDPNIAICDDIKSKLLKTKAFTAILEKEYENYDSSTFGLYNILELFNDSDEEFLEYMFKIYSYINSFEYPLDWLKEKIEKYNVEDINDDLYTLDFGKEIYNYVISELKIMASKITLMISKLENSEDFEKYIEMLNIDLENVNRCLKCSNNSWDLLHQNLNLLKENTINMPRNKVVNELLKEELKSFRKVSFKDEIEKLFTNIYSKSSNILLDLKSTYKYLVYIYNFIERADIEYTKQKQDAGCIDFSDIEHLALKVLIKKELIDGKYNYNITDEAEKYREKYLEIYTDEYQDTSYVQEAILNAVSNKNNRFMVGDIKQSIYKFRQAMPEIFNSKYNSYEHITNLENINEDNVKIILSKNFRSRKNVIDCINYIFSKIMSDKIGNSNYTETEKLEFGNNQYIEDENTDYNTEINILDLKSDEDFTDEETIKYINELKDFEIESKYIASKINEIVNEKPFKVLNMKNKTFSNVKYNDIVILLRNIKDKGNILLEELKKSCIPAFSDSTTNLFDNDEVKLVLSFLKIIDNIYLDIDLVGVMYSIIGKFTLDEIYEIKNYDKKDYIYNCLKKIKCDEKLSNKINSFLCLIEKFRNYTKLYNVSEILARVYKETHIYNQVVTLENSNEAKINLDSLVDVASNVESLTIYEYIGYIESLKNKQSDTTTAKIIGENENVVRIMTIHKSKGLEFPVVILASTSSKYNNKDLNSKIILTSNLGIGINVINEDLEITYPSVIKEGIKTKMSEETKSEELRMLYVAMTRAKEKLYIFGTVKDYTKKMSNMFLMYDENKVDSSLIRKNNSYMDNILMALYKDLNSNSLKEIINLNVIGVKNKENLEIISDNIKVKKENINDKLKHEYINSTNTEYIDNKADNLKNIIEYEYKYMEDVLANKKVSVSELKKSKIEEDEIKIIQDTKLKIPECLNENNIKYSSARKGTLIHFILEYLDFKKINNAKDMNNYLNLLIENNIISEEDRCNIDINSILEFLSSDIGRQIKDSKYVKKEVEFILKDDSISKSVIQGVIDLYYLNEYGSYTLVDFKTDNLVDEKDYIQRYKLQLDIYKNALEKLTCNKVSNIYIYSFKLGRKIKI